MAKRQKPEPGKKRQKAEPTRKKKTSTSKPSKKMGRPSKYSDELADIIFQRMHTPKPRGVFDVIKDTDINIGETTFLRWLREREDFRRKYTHAREVQADRLVWNAKAIADLCAQPSLEMLEFLKVAGDSIGSALNAWMQRARLQVDTYKWIAGKLAPKKYGKAADDGETEEAQTVNMEEAEKLIPDMSEEEAAKLYHEVLTAG